MIQDKYNDNSEKYNKSRVYQHYRNYINDVKNKYMGFSNMYKNSPNRYFYDSRRNHHNYYRYNNNNAYNGSAYGGNAYGSNAYGSNAYGSNAYGSNAYGSNAYGSNAYGSNAYGSNAYGNNTYKPLRNKRSRSYASTSNSKNKDKFTKKYKNYDVADQHLRSYRNGRKRSYSSMRKLYDKDSRYYKTHLESRYNDDYKNKYMNRYNLSKKRNYYSYRKKIYNSDRQNYDTHYGQGNIFYNNEYYLFNDGATLKKKKMQYGSSFQSKSKSNNIHMDRRIYIKKRYRSRNNRFSPNNHTAGSRQKEENSYTEKEESNKSNRFALLRNKNSNTYGTRSSKKSDEYFGRKYEQGDIRADVERGRRGGEDKESDNVSYDEKMRKNSRKSYKNNYTRRNRKRGEYLCESYSTGGRTRRSSDDKNGTNSSSKRGSYSTRIQKKKQHVGNKYSDSYKKTYSDDSSNMHSRKRNAHKRNRIIRKMGDGTFGRVLLCQHVDSKKYYAVKVVRNIKKYTKSAKIEADILKKIQNDDNKNNNIVKYHGKFMYYDHMCLIFEPLGPSLYEIITKNNYNGFHIEDIKLYCIEILKALNYLRKLSLTHTDLKPENILLDDPYFEKTLATVRRGTDGKRVQIYRTKSTGIKLIDFGCATFKSDYHGSIINTRQYRAPEVILNLGWDVTSDMWSFGCVLAEMYTGNLLFRTHEHLEHLAMMENIIQPIPKKMLYQAQKTSGSKYLYKDQLRLAWPENASSVNSIKHVKKCLPLYKIIKHDLFCDFLYCILQIDPDLRSSPSELLKHKFLQENYDHF
ncbi:protein serine/threonine kinase-1, putative [Plasmodium ovale]|uniref:Protein serine/threonine kinase-1, putative n=2 Tax=Plasmodium ovale TaxID=36330 RepID=A0A1C3KWA4_PLAOA|nr:protein serine/threonine kinase-1, putative [Plasmodium ovale]